MLGLEVGKVVVLQRQSTGMLLGERPVEVVDDECGGVLGAKADVRTGTASCRRRCAALGALATGLPRPQRPSLVKDRPAGLPGVTWITTAFGGIGKGVRAAAVLQSDCGEGYLMRRGPNTTAGVVGVVGCLLAGVVLPAQAEAADSAGVVADVAAEVFADAEQVRVSPGSVVSLPGAGGLGVRVPDSQTVPVAKDDGSVQLATVIGDARAPEVYRYDLALPAGASLAPLTGGRVAIVGADGAFLGGFAAPWAKGRDGATVPTHYEVDGSTLVQVVNHGGLPDSSYPLVADPWLGRDLLRQPWVTWQRRGYVIHVNPTRWGRRWDEPFVFSAFLDELRTKLGGNARLVTGTIEQQFYCHIAGSWYPTVGTWEMESWRPERWWVRQLNPWTRCNPRR